MDHVQVTRQRSPLSLDLTRRAALGRGAALGGLLASGGIGALLSACGSDAPSDTTGAAVEPDQVANASGTIGVLNFSFYQVPIPGTDVEAEYAAATVTDEIVTKARSSNAPFDVVLADAGIAAQLSALGRLTAIDTALLSNYESVSESLRNAPNLKADDNTFGVPFSGAVGLTAWDDSLVPEPMSVTDLAGSDYAGMVGLLNDYTTLPAFAFALGLDSRNMSTNDLEQVMEFLDTIKPNVKTLYTFGDEIQLFGRGDIGVANLSFGSLFLEAQSANSNLKANFAAAQTYLDSYTILAGADVAASLAWIDAVISADGQQAILEASGGLPVVESSRVAGTQPDVIDALSTEEVIALAPIYPGFPIEADADRVTLDQATSAWNDFASSFS